MEQDQQEQDLSPVVAGDFAQCLLAEEVAVLMAGDFLAEEEAGGIDIGIGQLVSLAG